VSQCDKCAELQRGVGESTAELVGWIGAMSGLDPLDEPRVALQRRDWRRVLELLAAGGSEANSAEGLELRARAAYGNGDFEASVSAWEDLHALLVAEGDAIEAARAAAMTAMYLMMDTGLMAPVRGWLQRAERLLDGHGEAPAHAVIAMVRTYERFMCGDMDAARMQSALAIELGRRLGVTPAVVIGRVAAARLKIFDGQVDEGLDLLDEVGVLLMSGEVDALTTGMMYCELICAAQGLVLHDRASEWTELMERWRHGAAFGGINGRCRVHRAELLRVSGPCDLAEEEALGACDELRPWMRREFGWPLAELGNIRLRRGDLAGAEEAFIAAHEHAWSPFPGLALLRLAQGDVDSASALIADAIAHPLDVPSKERPPFGDLRLAPLLDAQAEIAAAAGDADTVRRAADALQSIADSYSSPSLGACAALAKARAALISGDVGRAIEGSATAIAAWAAIGAPFETAGARMVLGEAHRRSGNIDGARMEWRAARAAFEAFGAIRCAEQAGRLLTEAPPNPTPSPSRDAATATFRCDGDTRTVGFGEHTVLMRDLKGFRYLERLLADPGREFHVLDLVAVERGSLPTGPTLHQGLDTVAERPEGGLPFIDDQARDAYRRRLAEVDDDIEEATQMNDVGRIELAQHDREYLIAELTRAVGLGGHHRSAGGSAERARTSVTRTLRYAVGRLAQHHPALAMHLEQTVHTGTYCRYAPDPLTPILWHL
jgi:tetratricopeptide (TPR) repeat protein